MSFAMKRAMLAGAAVFLAFVLTALSGTLDNKDPTGVFSDLPLQGSYSVGITVLGRATGKMTTSDGTRNYVYNIINQQRVEMLETDTSITALGDAIRQF